MITFFIAGDVTFSTSDQDTFLLLDATDAADLMRWLGYPCEGGSPFGTLPVSDLKARCRRRLWPIPRNTDPALESRRRVGHSGAVLDTQKAREAGFLRKQTQRLLALAERASEPNAMILFG